MKVVLSQARKINKHLNCQLLSTINESEDSDTEAESDGYYTPVESSMIETPIKVKVRMDSNLTPSHDNIMLHQREITTNIPSPMEDDEQQMQDQRQDFDITEAKKIIQDSATVATPDEMANPQPKTVNLEIVMAMFEKLQEAKMSPTNNDQPKSSQNEVLQEVKTAMEAIDDQDKHISSLFREVDYYKQKSTIMLGVIEDLNMTVQDLTQKVENLEINQAKKSITVTGIQLERNRKQDNIEFMYYFFQNNIGIQVDIEDVFLLGGGESSSVCVVTFATLQEKYAVFNNKGRLKGQTNEDGKPYFINDYLPTTTNEKKKRERDIIKQNKSAEKPLEIKYTRQGLTIQGDVYRKKVSPPTPRELINISSAKIGEILKQKITKGPRN